MSSSAPTKACVTRLSKEYKALLRQPVPHISAHPLQGNITEWHFALEGPSGSPYEGGVYHGRVVFPPNFPFRAPSILMTTPSGRFAVGQKICMSMTDFHQESWNPLWSVSTLLLGLLSFMLEEQSTTGSISSSDEEKVRGEREEGGVERGRGRR